MATLNVPYSIHYRAAVTGSKFDLTDPSQVGPWFTLREDALPSAGDLLARYGRTVNISPQARIMFDDQAAELNAARQAKIDEARD